MKRQWRVRWQRLGMSRPKVRVYETRDGAERLALKLCGMMSEAYPGLVPGDSWCCAGGYVEMCGCGGETWAERWARESAQVPPLIDGPHIDSREVGEWEHKVISRPGPLPAALVTAFEEGSGQWPIPEPSQDQLDAPTDKRVEDIPW